MVDSHKRLTAVEVLRHIKRRNNTSHTTATSPKQHRPTTATATASSSIVIFVTLLGFLSYKIQSDLHLTSYHYFHKHNNKMNSSFCEAGMDKMICASILRSHKKLQRLTGLLQDIQKSPTGAHHLSPACYPHFKSIQNINDWTWSTQQKFNRIYFYHTRKAGGTSLANYFSKVALHHGLEFGQDEWSASEEPGSVPGTFYITHLREPVDRSISHFKYQGRWNCSDLLKIRRTDERKFIPTEDNARKIDTWTESGGHEGISCPQKGGGIEFRLGICAVNCYSQWFSGLSCPEFNTTAIEQYKAAKATLLRYNFIVVLERLRDASYVNAIEKFFGVPGVWEKHAAYCERTSHKANSWVPLTILDETKQKLTNLNELDVGLYKELTDCLNDKGVGQQQQNYNFPRLDISRFDRNMTMAVPYNEQAQWKKDKRMQKKAEAHVEISIGQRL